MSIVEQYILNIRLFQSLTALTVICSFTGGAVGNRLSVAAAGQDGQEVPLDIAVDACRD